MKNRYNFQLVLAAFLFLFSIQILWSQSNEAIAQQYLQMQAADWNLEATDFSELILKDQFQTRHNGVWHLYFQQKYQGIELRNSMLNVAILNEKVLHFGNRLVGQIANKVNATLPVLNASAAVLKAADFMEIHLKETLTIKESPNKAVTIFEKGNISQKDIRAELAYFLNENGALQLVWEITLDKIEETNYRTISIDAIQGNVAHDFNRILHCDFGTGHYLAEGETCNHDHDVHQKELTDANFEVSEMLIQDARYNVWEFPLESPTDGDLNLKLNPHDETASPFGWHDTNGDDDPDFTITRGNNVHAYADYNNSNQSQNDEVDGGSNLIFAPSFNANWEPIQYQDQSVLQLFYSSNMMHDIAYQHGFDEEAGNYQENNYGNGGAGSDYVLAEAQNGGTSSSNNADFSINADGQNSRMQLYLWNQMGLLTVNEPVSLSGIYETRGAQFGAQITDTPVSGEVVIVDDGSALPTLGCFELQNAAEVNGKIAMIDRGDCDYSEKVLNAQNAGAIAAIICSFDGGSFNEMGQGSVGGQIDIPAVLIQYNDCQTIRQFASNGLLVSLVQPQTDGPERLDGALDNTTVAHEYAHGISTRLTGGASSANCLGNDEQMGEGWSDFFAMAVTAKPNQNGTEARGMSTYSLGQGLNGGGARRFSYSTDFNINGQTYHDIIGGVRPHPVGEVWASILWDLHWALVDEYGFDEDLFNGTGGNNLALRLVMDGMKLQPCSPGFVDGRDAILSADLANNNGDNQCLIWETFAKRGVGFGAEQRFSNSRNDGKEAYESLPACIKELKITKNMTAIINPGDEIDVILRVTNHKDTEITNVVVTDVFPVGATFIAGSASTTPTIDGDIISFYLGGMNSGEMRLITYKMMSSSDEVSNTLFIDDMEGGEAEWDLNVLEGNNLWEISNAQANSGSNAWFATDSPEESDFILEKKDAFYVQPSAEKPVLRFYHWYDTEWGFDGGIVEVSTDFGATWEIVDDKMFRNGYETVLSFFAFNVSKMPAFAGDGDNFRPTYVDLSAYSGQGIRVRFRFASDEETSVENNVGWFVDDVEMMDMYNYNSEACAMSAEGDMACAEAVSRGTIVESTMVVSTEEVLQNVDISVYPNPTKDFLQMKMNSEKPENLQLSMITIDGKTVLVEELEVNGQQHFSMDVSALSAGFYFLKITNESGILTKKIVIE
ncbi:MAG: extracellular elastinolytic metalloproteinase [Saprospiraceae bacterium]|jgi:extracellular elastinolytic metalloproteinase